MATKSARAIARLTLLFELEPDKYIKMNFDHVNPNAELARVGHQIAALTDYRDRPLTMTTSIV